MKSKMRHNVFFHIHKERFPCSLVLYILLILILWWTGNSSKLWYTKKIWNMSAFYFYFCFYTSKIEIALHTHSSIILVMVVTVQKSQELRSKSHRILHHWKKTDIQQLQPLISLITWTDGCLVHLQLSRLIHSAVFYINAFRRRLQGDVLSKSIIEYMEATNVGKLLPKSRQ